MQKIIQNYNEKDNFSKYLLFTTTETDLKLKIDLNLPKKNKNSAMKTCSKK